MADELLLSQQDRTQTHCLIRRVAQTHVVRIIVCHHDLGMKCLKRRLVKNWRKQTVIWCLAVQNSTRTPLQQRAKWQSLICTCEAGPWSS